MEKTTRKILLSVLLLLLFGILQAQASEHTYVLTEDTPVWTSDAFDKYDVYEADIVGTLKRGTEVTMIGNFAKKRYIKREGVLEVIEFIYGCHIRDISNNKTYWIDLSTLIPTKTSDLFDTSIVTTAHNPSKYLIRSYLADVLTSGTHDTMKKYEAEFIDMVGEGDEYHEPWWEAEGIVTPAIVTQAYINFSIFAQPKDIVYYIQSIEKMDDGYKIGVYSDSYIYLQQDGDYLDIYKGSLENKIASFIYVTPEFYEEVDKLVRGISLVDDLTNMVLPRYADGSSDYDNKIIERQEIPQRITNPLEYTFIVPDETTTVAQLEEAKEKLGEDEFKKLIHTENYEYGKFQALNEAITNKAKKEVVAYLINYVTEVEPFHLELAIWGNANIETIQLLLEHGSTETINDYEDGYYSSPLLEEAIGEENRQGAALLAVLLNAGAKLYYTSYTYQDRGLQQDMKRCNHTPQRNWQNKTTHLITTE